MLVENTNPSVEIEALKEKINRLEEEKHSLETDIELAEGTNNQLQDYIDELEKKLTPHKPNLNEPRYITVMGVKYRV